MTPSAYMLRVKQCHCVICLARLGVRTTPCEAHHIGTGNEHDDFLTAALCVEHHRGATGIHGLHRKAFHRLWNSTDLLLIAWTNREMAK